MEQIEKLGTLTDAGPCRITVIASTQDVDRTGDSVVTAGIDVSAYMRGGVVLFQHDPNQPIARCVAINRGPQSLTATIEFPAEGKVKNSDRIYAMVKSHLLNGVSIGFLPTESKPIDPKNPRKGALITKSELLEISLVTIPANAAAMITHRAARLQPRPVQAGLSPARSKRMREAELIALGVDLDTPPRTAEQRRAAARAARLADLAEIEAKAAVQNARIAELQAVLHRTPEQLHMLSLGIRPPGLALTYTEQRSIASRKRLNMGLIPGSRAERQDRLRALGILKE